MTWGDAEVWFGDVEVTRQVISFTGARTDSGAPLGETPLDLPPRHLRTRAMWWTVSEAQAGALAAAGVDLPGAAHAAEHASIGLLPLFATCDRWDIGGVSTDLHPATGRLTVFVYDGHDGGAGFAERGFEAAAAWLRPPGRRSPAATAKPAAPPASSRPNAETATTRCPSGARWPCWTPCWPTRAECPPGAVASSAVLQRICLATGGGKRRRAPPGGRAAPARTVRPWGGRPAPSYQ